MIGALLGIIAGLVYFLFNSNRKANTDEELLKNTDTKIELNNLDNQVNNLDTKLSEEKENRDNINKKTEEEKKDANEDLEKFFNNDPNRNK